MPANNQISFNEWIALVKTILAFVAPVEEFLIDDAIWYKRFAEGMRASKAAAIAIEEWQTALKVKHS